MANLTPEEQRRRQKLTIKLSTKTLTLSEADELKRILEKEKESATSGGDILAALAVAVLIGLVIAYLSKK